MKKRNKMCCAYKMNIEEILETTKRNYETSISIVRRNGNYGDSRSLEDDKKRLAVAF